MAPRLPANLRPLEVVFVEWWRRLGDIDVACSELTRACSEGRLFIVRYVDGKPRTEPRKRTRIDRDPADRLTPAVFVGNTVQAGAFYVSELAGENESDTKNIFGPDKAPRVLSGKTGKGGRPPIHNWEEINPEIVRRLFVNGRLKLPGDEGKFVEDIVAWCAAKYRGKAPDESDLHRKLAEVKAVLKAAPKR